MSVSVIGGGLCCGDFQLLQCVLLIQVVKLVGVDGDIVNCIQYCLVVLFDQDVVGGVY